MGKARDLARLSPNSSGLLPNANIEAVAASKLTGQVPDANAPSGSVIQVVQSVKTDTWSANGSSFFEVSGYSVTITPSSTANKVMVEVCLHVGESSDSFPLFRLYRNGTELQIAPTIGSGAAGMFGKTTTTAGSRDQYFIQPVNFKFLDSPNTTGACTYTVKIRPFGVASRTVYVNRSEMIGDQNQYTCISTFTATEISA